MAATQGMALLGKAAMLPWYDIVPEHRAEHDQYRQAAVFVAIEHDGRENQPA